MLQLQNGCRNETHLTDAVLSSTINMVEDSSISL
jgi:hypothetical protein